MLQVKVECSAVMAEEDPDALARLGALELVRQSNRTMQRSMDSLASELRQASDAKSEVERQVNNQPS